MADAGAERRLAVGTPIAVALLSAALIAYEIVLMRRLLIERWHHFGYLVISVALLGFGASGTLLAIVERRVRRHPEGTLFWSAAGLVLALLAMPRLAALLPASARFIPDDLWLQVGWWSLYWLTAFVPFLVGATFLGAALMTAGRQVGGVYAANLFGSGVGAAGAALLVSRFSIEHAVWPSLALVLLAMLLLSRRPVGVAATLVLALLALSAEWFWPQRLAYDEHKYAARLQLLASQGSVRRVDARADPHGYVELYESKLFHNLPFLSVSEAPPPMYSLLINGDPAASVLRIGSPAEATVMDNTLMALPYRLIPPRPAVLLVGETGGANAWLARRQDATTIDVVQPNAAVAALLREWSPALLEQPGLHLHTCDARCFLAPRGRPPYDLIHIVSLEGLGVGGAGMRGLAEDHLATVEGMAECLCALSDGGVLSVSRGIQQPPRENIRLLATLVEALESVGVAQPARHVVQVRDYLGVCTMALRSPLDEQRRAELRTAIAALNLTPVWYAGLPLEEVNQPDALAGPPGSSVDWLHYAAGEILSDRREQFYNAWMLNVRPPHDDNPFFWDFYKRQAIAELKRAYGDLWLTRAELGRLFLYVSLAVAGAAAVALILLPLATVGFLRRQSEPGAAATGSAGRPHSALWTVLYFAAIGLGFMLIEMVLISRAIRWLGDPVIASALVIGGILVTSGVGSLTHQRVTRGHIWLAPAAVAAAAVLLRLVGWSAAPGGPWLLVTAALPAAYLMGTPMPGGLRNLNERAPALVPWAWGINGVASVIGTSTAMVVAMTAGYRLVMLTGALAYGVATLAAIRLASNSQSSPRVQP